MAGALAILTIGIAFLIGVFLLTRHHFDPKNRAATKEVLKDGPSAAGGGPSPEHGSRLDRK